MEMLEYGVMVTLLGMAVVYFVLGINWALIKFISLLAGDSGAAAPKAEKPDKNLAAAIAAAVSMYEKDEKLVR